MDAHVQDEWSLAQTLRHLVLVTDFLATATPELLAEERNNPWGGGDWHPTAGDCVRSSLNQALSSGSRPRANRPVKRSCRVADSGW